MCVHLFFAFGSNKEILIARKNEENNHVVRTKGLHPSDCELWITRNSELIILGNMNILIVPGLSFEHAISYYCQFEHAINMANKGPVASLNML